MGAQEQQQVFPTVTAPAAFSSDSLQMARAFAAREGAIMMAGIRAMQPQTRLLFALRAASAPPPTVPPSVRTRFASRASLDLLVAAPWVPVFALIPGAVFLFSAAASLAPRLLPSTFAVARAARPAAPPPPASPVAAAAAASPPLTPRFAADAPSAPLAAALPAGAAAALAAAAGLGAAADARRALAAYGDGLQADDALLADEEALGAGAFRAGAGAAELREAARARLLPVGPAAGEEELRAAVRNWLVLRRAQPPLCLLHAMAARAAGKRAL